MTTELKITDEVKVKIVRELIEPYYIQDIKTKIKGKRCWKMTGQIFETTSKILVAFGGILSFSSGYYKDPLLSFFAGSVSTLSLATLQFASFAYMENKRQTNELNVLLKILNIDTIPQIEQNLQQQQSLDQFSSRKFSAIREEEKREQ